MSVRSRATEAASREAPLRLKYVLEVGSRNRALEEGTYGPLDIGYAEIMNFAEMKFVVNNKASKGDAQKWKFYMKWALQEHMVNAASSPGAEYPMEIFDMRGDLVFTVFFKKKPEAGWEAAEERDAPAWKWGRRTCRQSDSRSSRAPWLRLGAPPAPGP